LRASEISMAITQEELRRPLGRQLRHGVLVAGLPLLAISIFAVALIAERATHLDAAVLRGVSIETEISEWYEDIVAFGPVFALTIVGLVCTSIAMVRRGWGEQRALMQLRDAAQAAQDESQRRLALEQQLRQAQRMEILGQVAIGGAHDLNNVLNVVIGNLEMLRPRCDDPWRLKRVDEALAAALLGEKVIGSIMSFARGQAAARKIIDVNALLRGIEGMLRHALGAEARLEMMLAAGDCRIDADAVQLELAALNMVLNARDSRPADGVVRIASANIRLDGRPDGLVGDFVAVTVTDKGLGMPPDVLARAFEPFFTTKAPGRGSGLGLSQIHGFAKQHGGTAAIASEAGKGTTVTLYLPCAP
jgi:signal transduction histidine kinase